MLNFEKMNGQNRSVSNIRHPRYVKGGKCSEPIEREETLNEFDNKVIELGKEEEASIDNFICNSIDKNHEIEVTLTSLHLVLAKLEKTVKQVKERYTRLCELTNLQMSDL